VASSGAAEAPEVSMGFARLLVLAEERLLGRGLASLLEQHFEAHSIDSFERAGRFLNADRAEIALWLGDRLDADIVAQLCELKRAHPGLRLCLLARAADADALRPLLRSHACGVGVLFRNGDLDIGELQASLREILAGRSTLEPAVLERLIAEGADEDALTTLTPGEHEVLELVAQGLRNREIARRVWKSEKAVEKQVSHVFEKLGLDQRTAPHLDRRVAAARIFFTCRPQSIPAMATRDTPPRAGGHALLSPRPARR
jgi:DNA-binding NarL/FixJ family response regulator